MKKNKSVIGYGYSSENLRKEYRKFGNVNSYGKKNLFVRLLLWLSSKKRRGFVSME